MPKELEHNNPQTNLEEQRAIGQKTMDIPIMIIFSPTKCCCQQFTCTNSHLTQTCNSHNNVEKSTHNILYGSFMSKVWWQQHNKTTAR